MKYCSKCKKQKLLNDFIPHKKAKSGRSGYCRECHSKYSRDRLRNNPKFRIISAMRSGIWQVFKRKPEGGEWESLVGYTLEDLMQHLEKQFEPWMKWDNYGMWEIDHIVPKSHFKYETAKDLGFKKCWALKNLRPIERTENRQKNSKLTKTMKKLKIKQNSQEYCAFWVHPIPHKKLKILSVLLGYSTMTQFFDDLSNVKVEDYKLILKKK